jgi:hypothetical protein
VRRGEEDGRYRGGKRTYSYPEDRNEEETILRGHSTQQGKQRPDERFSTQNGFMRLPLRRLHEIRRHTTSDGVAIGDACCGAPMARFRGSQEPGEGFVLVDRNANAAAMTPPQHVSGMGIAVGYLLEPEGSLALPVAGCRIDEEVVTKTHLRLDIARLGSES